MISKSAQLVLLKNALGDESELPDHIVESVAKVRLDLISVESPKHKINVRPGCIILPVSFTLCSFKGIFESYV